VKGPGKAKVAYPNGDAFEGAFNEALQKHGRGVYIWGTAVGNNPWVPEEGFPGACFFPRAIFSPTPLCGPLPPPLFFSHPHFPPPLTPRPFATALAEGKAPTVSYDGMYKEGKKAGVGKLSLPNGDKYHGSFAADKFDGEGTYFSANGDIYSGSWRAGVKQGEGQMMFAKDESQLVGTFHKGHMVTGKWIWKDGTSWHGPFKNSQPLGRGVFYFPNGMVQEGEYVTEGEAEEGDDAALKTVWKGGPTRAANTSAQEVTRAN
jgi:hypothetical protein